MNSCVGKYIVHSKPSAEIKAKLSKAKEQKKYICELEFNAYDTDALSKENKGITKEKYEWKRVDESNWTNGTVPKIIDANQVYLQKYMVCDELGEWSSPCVEVISELEGDEVEPFSDDEPPTVVITVSDENPSLGDEILVSVAPDDNIGIKSVNTYVGGKAVSKFPGSFVYKCDRAGELVIRAGCEDVSGNRGSDTKTITVTDRRDLDPPEIIVDTKSDITVTDDTVVIKGTIKDPEFDSYKVSLTENGSEESRELLTSGEEVFDSEIVSFRYSEAGKYTVLIEACDKSSNRSYCKVDLKIEWMNYIDSNPYATAKDIYQFAGKMMDDYGLSGLQIHPYGK